MEAVARNESRITRREELIHALLRGADIAPGEARFVLGYELERLHAACVLTGPDRALEPAARRCAASLSDATPLLFSPAPGELWAWISVRPRADDAAPLADDAAYAINDSDISAVIAGPRAGVDGFREAHRMAVGAATVAPHTGGVRDGGTLALKALVRSDPVFARTFAHGVLGPLSADDARMHDLRVTLAAVLDHGRRGAAHRLPCHINTVAYRMRTIEALLGEPIDGRRMELSTALLILDALTRDAVAMDA